MKTIEEAANEIYPLNKPTMYTQFVAGLEQSAFKAGVEFAQRWIPVEEELPENQELVLVKTNFNCFSTAYFHGKNSGFIIYGDDAYERFGIITHWRPIEIK